MATLVQMNENDQKIIAKTMAEYNFIDFCIGFFCAAIRGFASSSVHHQPN
jgi:hypothetical protein